MGFTFVYRQFSDIRRYGLLCFGSMLQHHQCGELIEINDSDMLGIITFIESMQSPYALNYPTWRYQDHFCTPLTTSSD
jgi:hypothetical protein